MARDAVNILIGPILIGSTGVPVQAPGFIVPDGCTVYVRAHNGGATGNAAPVTVGRNRDRAVSGPNIPIAPNTQVGYPCNNTADICISGTAGDGVVISILG